MRRVVVCIGLLGLLGLLATASARGAVAAKSRAVVRGVTDTTITVGGLGHALLYSGADIGAKARFGRENAAGGVNGRTITYVGLRDDLGVGAVDQQAAKGLVEQDQVFAVVPVVTPDLGAVTHLTRQKVPYFGWALSSNFCGNLYGFGFTGCLFPPGGRTTSNAWGVLVKTAFAPLTAKPSAVLLTENTPSGQYVLNSLMTAVKSAGITVSSATSNLPVPAVGDYGGIAAGVLRANGGRPPDAVFVVGSYSNIAAMQRALRDGGYTGLFTDTIEYDPDLVVPAAGSAVMLQTAAFETAATNPAMQQLVTDVRAIAPFQPIDQAVAAGYWSADLFIAAVKRAGKNLTAARLIKVANNGFTYRVANTVGPTKFPAAHNAPTPCGSLVHSDGAAFSVMVPYRCGKVVPVKP
jgi:ABC-type branched-subunit amino acid transport system substrate-binding protein